MPKSKHNTTKRGTQKQRVKTHMDMLHDRYPRVWQRIIDFELAAYRASKNFQTESE